jgi:glycosyltransferase involved in cell wall biosynthesis
MSQRQPVIVFNALALLPGGSGVQTYERELLKELPHALNADLRAVVQKDSVGELGPGIRPLVRTNSSGARRALAGLRSPGECDLFHGLDVDIPYRPGCATVSTVHDLSVFDVPWATSRHRGWGERILVASAMKRADAIVSVSQFTAERVKALFGRECAVIGEAPSDDMYRPGESEVHRVRVAYSLPERFVLHVGTVEPRKNLGVLAEACKLANAPLVLAGKTTKAARLVSGTTMIGHIPRELLRGLYGAATLVAFSSSYEGFGLPAVEAMACGAPVVASRIPPLEETIGEDGVLVAPGDTCGWAAAIAELMSNRTLREDLASRGPGHVAGLSWKDVAARTANVYRSLGVSL